MAKKFMGMRYLGKTERTSEPESPFCDGSCPCFEKCDPESGVCLLRDEAEALAEQEADARRDERDLGL